MYDTRCTLGDDVVLQFIFVAQTKLNVANVERLTLTKNHIIDQIKFNPVTTIVAIWHQTASEIASVFLHCLLMH